jgi:alkylation response protein AidB-like acyl-CoA dehydrogenase
MVDLDELRAEVHSWLAGNWSLEITVREWWRRLYDAGLSMPTWPAPYGRGYPGAAARVVTEELAALGAIAPPMGGMGVNLAGPTILEHGTPEQQARYLPGILRGEESWCQLFSEPDAGSDLAGVGTTAVPDGDELVVNGQKVWNSGADVADRGLLLARTDPDLPKHAGLTYFLLDMNQPGIEARPLRQMNGESHFCEVFLNDARVSSADMLGERGAGWRVAATTLRSERATVGSRAARGLVQLPSGSHVGVLDRTVGDLVKVQARQRAITGSAVPARKLIQLAQERGVNNDPHVRQQLVGYYTLTELNRFVQQRIRATGGQGPGASIVKLLIAKICHTSREVGFAVLGPDAMLWGEDSPYGGDLQTVGLASFGTSIGGGTDEIQRNVIGERTLGLPREPQVDKDVPYRDLRVGTRRNGESK